MDIRDMKLSNHDKPTNPTTVKIFAAITLLTLFGPSWVNQSPMFSETMKQVIEWSFKGLDLFAMIVAIFTNGGINYKSNYFNTSEKSE
jgi:hypothetical protein